MSESRTTGSRSMTGRGPPLGWLPWLALVLLALLALIAFLVVPNVADDGDRPGVDVTNERSQGQYIEATSVRLAS